MDTPSLAAASAHAPHPGLDPALRPIFTLCSEQIFPAFKTARLSGGGFVTGSFEGHLRHLDSRGQLVSELDSPSPLNGLCPLADQRMLISGGNSGRCDSSTLSLWDLKAQCIVGTQKVPELIATPMAPVGGGLILAGGLLNRVWLVNPLDGNLRPVDGISSGDRVHSFCVLADGLVAANIKNNTSASPINQFVIWHGDRDWAATTVTSPAYVKTIRAMLPLSRDRLLVLGDSLEASALYQVDAARWSVQEPLALGSLAHHRWREPGPNDENRCASYGRRGPDGRTRFPSGGVSPNLWFRFSPLLFLESTRAGPRLWDLRHNCSAPDATVLADQPAGMVLDAPYQMLRLGRAKRQSSHQATHDGPERLQPGGGGRG